MKLLLENWRKYVNEAGRPDKVPGANVDLHIKPSEIHGKGIFADQRILKGTDLGISHVRKNGMWTIPDLGRWHNHSDNPSCHNILDGSMKDKTYTRNLITSRDIEPGEEITADYRFQPDLEQPGQWALKEARLVESDNAWYHTTHESTADSVEEEGIHADHGGFVGGFTLGGHWADEIYGMRPVYLSKEPNKSATREYEGTSFEINIGDDLLLPDLPSLEDFDANKEDDHFWWSDRDEVPEPLQTYMNNAGWGSPYQDDTYNDVYFEELVDVVRPRTALQQAVIDTTGTAVSLRGYTPDEIKRVI